MLTREKLLALYRNHSAETVLSVYMNSDQHDPAARSAWRVRLERNAAEVRSRLDGSDADGHQAFDSALTLLRKEIGVEDDAFLPGRGWVGFATPTAVIYSDRLPVPMPDLVRWERGIRVAPYVRALKQNRPVLVVLADSREGRIFQYREGRLDQIEHLTADTEVGDLTDVGSRKRATQRSGMRGKTGTDAAQNILETAASRLTSRIVEELEQRSDNALLVIGGVRERVAALQTALSRFDDRMAVRESMHLDMNHSEIVQEVEAAASALTGQLHDALLERVTESASPGGKGCLGRDLTEQALRDERVRVLLVSSSLARRDPDYADRLIGTAFGTSGAEAHLIAGAAGERLDAAGDGVGALLHYGTGS